MNTTATPSTKALFGRVGLVIVAVVFIVAVALSNTLFRGMRVDLTENGLYTLSDGTRNILGDIAEPINLYFFYSDRATAEMPYIRTYAGRVKEILDEFAEYADGKLNVAVIDPLPFSEDEDRAAEFGLQAVNAGGSAEPIYMGIAGTNSVDDEETIPFLDPAKESFLEYDIAKLIDTLARPERPVIGLISGLQMDGGFEPRTQRPGEPWVMLTQIEQLFDVRRLPTTANEFDEDIAVLMVVHPKALSDATLYAIDQFIMRGGHALLMVDPYAEIDMPTPDPNNPAAAMMASRASNLNRLTEAWGVSTSTDQYVADEKFALTISGM
ncbi:MAG: GldG family protein, partial [Gammaproteobacteria bacterium]